MAKKAKQNVDKIVKKVNKEFEKTSAQIEGLVNDDEVHLVRVDFPLFSL